ncbi:MAG: hypothetical protein HY289_06440, partial [Planctomycetes bacterium]|nr:hypothetical protein [Planctomycetota bacterium]
MTTRFRIGIAAVTVMMSLALLACSDSSFGKDKKDNKPVDVAVKEIAAALKKGEKDKAKQLAEAAAKNLEDIPGMMHLFKTRKMEGLGVGTTPLANPAKDGIEVMIRDLARDVPGGIAKLAPALEEMGYHIAAMGELSNAAVGKAQIGGAKKTKKAWTEYSEEMRTLGIAFSKAAAGKGGQEIKIAAGK